MIHPLVLHNGALVDNACPTLSAGQLGLLSGWGIFTTMRVIDGVFFEYDRHWARMSRDAAALHVTLPSDPEETRRMLFQLVEANHAQNSTLRLAVVRNSGGMWAGPPKGGASDVIALTADSKHWGSSVRLACTAHARHAASQFAGAKTLSWAMNLTWLESAQMRGFDEVILLNERGEAAECTSANLFAAYGNQVWTPPLSSGCLPGITREVLLHEIRVPGIEVVEKALLPADLDAADEVFITSTTRNLLRVAEIEGRPMGNSGAMREALAAAFQAYVNRYVEVGTARGEAAKR